MAEWGYILIGAAALIASSIGMTKTRTVLIFRSPGTIEPESIKDWQILLWRVTSALMAMMAIGLIYAGFEL